MKKRRKAINCTLENSVDGTREGNARKKENDFNHLIKKKKASGRLRGRGKWVRRVRRRNIDNHRRGEKKEEACMRKEKKSSPRGNSIF